MLPFSFAKLSLALLVLGGLAASLPVQAQNLYIAANNGDVRQVSPKNGANLGTFAAYDATMHLYAPTYINFDMSGNLLVINQPNVGISKFSPTGAFLESFGAKTALRYSAVAADALGNVFAANSYTHTIDKFSASGAALGTYLNTAKGITTPQGLAFDKAGNLYVSNSQPDGNTFNHLNSITKYAPDGTYLGVFATPNISYQAQTIAFNNDGNLFVGEFAGRSGAIQEFSATGADLGSALHNYGIYDPLQFAFDAANNIFVDDNGSVLEYSSTGTLLNPHLNINVSTTGLAFAPPAPAAAVPEASTTVSLGLLLAFGIGGLIVSRRKRSAS